MKTSRHIWLCVSALCLCAAARAAVPAGYYNSLNGKSGKQLKDAVRDLTVNHTVLSYSSLWYYFAETDARPENSAQVWDMYSNNTYYFGNSGSAVSGMNKEHSFPKSWWGGSKNDAYSDLHHLIPADEKANSARSNHPFGEVATSNWDNGVSRRGTPRSGQGGGSAQVFEPADEYKGDFARIYFYMVSCYQDLNWSNTYMLTNTDWRSLNTWSIELLLKWARQDPVSEKEVNRNDAIARYQNNRNPFVDNPDLMEYIWGNKVGTGFGTGSSVTPDPDPDPDETPMLITPTQGTILEFGDVALSDSATLTLYVRGQHIKQPLTLKCYLNNWQMFDLSTTTIDTLSANSEAGFPLRVTYKPTALGEHKAKLLFSSNGMTSIGIQLHANCVENAGLPGDVTGDGIVDVADINEIINCILDRSGDEEACDITGDGAVDVADINALINIILNRQ